MLEKKIISEIDRPRLARRGIGSGRLGIDTCANPTRVYLDCGVFWSFFMVFWGEVGGYKKKIISGIDGARLARPGIGNDWLGIDTCANPSRVFFDLGGFLVFF